MKKVLVGLIAMMLLLVGCSSSGNGLKEIKTSDLCVTHINLDSKICYGDEKKDVEQVTGEGEEITRFMSYENGIRIMYRNDKVAGISLSDESLDIYESEFAKIGDSKKSILENLGSDNSINEVPSNLDYLYDSQTKKFILGKPDLKETAEEMENVYIVSFMFDGDGNARSIMLVDWRMATFMQ
ncbi:hypothetical protein [Paenibacillus camelliae]|uniref:hypothetical protein n=1 Tax=Paenibacillus camelliae TaxID=512410 RepID=UPI00203C2A76|nr:hypothetical protein [Paenibacillus camelliae]MCM3632907.1 hypothetical protein [Paenibacillus camelliae]